MRGSVGSGVQLGLSNWYTDARLDGLGLELLRIESGLRQYEACLGSGHLFRDLSSADKVGELIAEMQGLVACRRWLGERNAFKHGVHRCLNDALVGQLVLVEKVVVEVLGEVDQVLVYFICLCFFISPLV